jgi:hypothetical protein
MNLIGYEFVIGVFEAVKTTAAERGMCICRSEYAERFKQDDCWPVMSPLGG